MLKLDEPLLARSGQSEEESASEYDREHLDYLERMASEGVVPRALAEKAAAVWASVRDATDGRMPVPGACVNEDGSIYYGWSEGVYELSCEISNDEPTHWVYSRRDTKKFWGEETIRTSDLPERIVNALLEVSKAADRAL